MVAVCIRRLIDVFPDVVMLTISLISPPFLHGGVEAICPMVISLSREPLSRLSLSWSSFLQRYPDGLRTIPPAHVVRILILLAHVVLMLNPLSAVPVPGAHTAESVPLHNFHATVDPQVDWIRFFELSMLKAPFSHLHA